MFSSLFYIQNLDESFHPSVIFGEPYLPHMGSNFGNFHDNIFVLVSFTQQWVAIRGNCDFGSPKTNIPIFGIYFT
jgi:hypothetical protein